MAEGGAGYQGAGELGHTDPSAWAPIIEWLREDPVISAWLTQEESELLSSDRSNVLPVWKAALLYQGFDFKRIIRNMIRNKRIYDTKHEREEVTVRAGSTDSVFSYSNRESMVSDLEFLIFQFAERSSTNRKCTAKSLPFFKKITDWLIEKYCIDIRVNASLTALSPDVITVPRIVACFPGKICEYFHRGYGNTPVTFFDIGIQQPENLSKAILCPYFTALIPREVMRASTTMHYVSFLVHVIVDDTLLVHKKTGNYKDLEDILTYYSAEYNTPRTPQGSRLVFCDRMGLLTPQRDRFLPILESLKDFAVGKIRFLRPHDPRLDAVLTELGRLV